MGNYDHTVIKDSIWNVLHHSEQVASEQEQNITSVHTVIL